MDNKAKTFVRAFCAHVYQVEGNAVVVIGGQNEELRPNVKIPVYDLDAGQVKKVMLKDLSEAKELRASESADFEFDAITSSRFADSAFEISSELFDDV